MDEIIVFWGETAQGGEILLGAPFSMEIKKDKGAADMLTVVFPAADVWENMKSIRGYSGEALIFSGICDEQTASCDSDGMRVEIVARSIAALLMDNEAMPQTLRNPSLAFISRHFLEPLGLRAVTGETGGKPGELVIKKGTSIMGVLLDFCRNFLRTEPAISMEGEVFCGEKPRVKEITLKKLLKWEITEKNCRVISEVYGKSSMTGNYSVRLINPEAKGITRRRYVNGPVQYDFTVKRQIKACVPEFMDVNIFDSIAMPQGFSATVTGLRISGGMEGLTTIVTAEEIMSGKGRLL